MILHIPHSSTTLPDSFQVLDGVLLEKEFQRMTDWFTDELFDYAGAKKLVFPYSRLYCDVERFRDDDKEEMVKKGMGVCYTSSSFGHKLRVVGDEEGSPLLVLSEIISICDKVQLLYNLRCVRYYKVRQLWCVQNATVHAYLYTFRLCNATSAHQSVP